MSRCGYPYCEIEDCRYPSCDFPEDDAARRDGECQHDWQHLKGEKCATCRRCGIAQPDDWQQRVTPEPEPIAPPGYVTPMWGKRRRAARGDSEQA